MWLVAVATAAMGIVVGLPSSASAATTGAQTFVVVAGPRPTDPRRVFAYGPVRGVGTVEILQNEGPYRTDVAYVFPQGTVDVVIAFTNQVLANPTPPHCVLNHRLLGTFQVTGGSGAFAGAQGGGSFRSLVDYAFFTPSGGSCGPPETFLLTERVLQGTVSLP